MATISEVFGIPGADTAIGVRKKIEGVAYPSKDDGYVFEQRQLKKLLRFFAGKASKNNLLITGPTGAGKTSVIEQVATRLGWPLYGVSCSGKTRFAHMLGGYSLVKGETVWCDGPLLQAMRHGGVFLADEITRMDAGEQMAFVRVLDNQAIEIPETGEVVKASPLFRVVATGNSGGFGDESGNYAGERVASIAFRDRFLHMEATYPDKAIEKEILARKVPDIPESIVDAMLSVASDTRDASIENGGNLRVILTTRSLISWGREFMDIRQMFYQGRLTASKIKDVMKESAFDAFLAGAPKDEKDAILEIIEKWS